MELYSRSYCRNRMRLMCSCAVLLFAGFALFPTFFLREARAATPGTDLHVNVIKPFAAPTPRVLPGNGEAFFFWAPATSTPGTILNDYDVGRSTISGGPYLFTSLGSTTQSSVGGLQNGTRYYFIIRVKNISGAPVATSTEFSVVPTSSIYNTKIMEFNPAVASTTSITNANGTRHEVAIPQNVLSTGEQLFMEMQGVPKSAAVFGKPLPSGKLASNTWFEASFRKYADMSAVTTVDEPVSISFYYTANDVSGIDESTLGAYRWDGSAWQLLLGSTVDTAQRKVSFSTTHFSTFTVMGTAPAVASTPSSSSSSSSGGGGGGGGGGGIIQSTTATAVFKGRAYPKSAVTLLKDAQVAATTIAGADANFEITLSNLSTGSFIFSLYGEDAAGRRSSLLSFPISLTAGATTNVAGIFIAPTIGVDKTEVKKGENIAIFGQSAPGSEVTVSVNSDEEFFGKVMADANGSYLYDFDTSVLDFGDHTTKAKAAKVNEITSFGKSAAFRVGNRTVLAAKATAQKTAKLREDVNQDGKINLVDYSILAYWYKKANPPASVDFNGDGKVSLVDFSILAFYWSG